MLGTAAAARVRNQPFRSPGIRGAVYTRARKLSPTNVAGLIIFEISRVKTAVAMMKHSRTAGERLGAHLKSEANTPTRAGRNKAARSPASAEPAPTPAKKRFFDNEVSFVKRAAASSLVFADFRFTDNPGPAVAVFTCAAACLQARAAPGA